MPVPKQAPHTSVVGPSLRLLTVGLSCLLDLSEGINDWGQLRLQNDDSILFEADYIIGIVERNEARFWVMSCGCAVPHWWGCGKGDPWGPHDIALSYSFSFA